MEKVRRYFQRIGLDMPEHVVPDAELLCKLQYAHCTTVPYENLDILRGRPLSLETDALYEKVVERRQGGFCFELNGLFAWLLSQLGYEVSEYAARYLRGERELPMRRHRVMIAQSTQGAWLCDVGIGEVCPRWPIRMEEGLVQRQQNEAYRLVRDRFLGWVLMDEHAGQWRPFYSFTEEPQLNVDYAAPTFWCEKHPDSPFNKQEMFSLKTAAGRITLDGRVFREFDGERVTERTVTEEELAAVYARFGLRL